MSVITDLIDENSSCHARISELEARIVWLECELQVNAAPVSEAKAQDFDPLVCDYCNAETQDPWHGSGMLNGAESHHIHACNQCRNLLPPTKAQGVVMPERAVIREVFMRNGFTIREGQSDLKPYVYAAAEELLQLAAPVQQVSVPDVSSMARILADRNADACNVNREDNWAIYGQDYIDDVTAMLAAAPAAPAADAGLVEALDYQALLDAIAAATSVYANGAINISVQAFRESLAAHSAKGGV